MTTQQPAFLLAKETVIDGIPGTRPELGFTLFDGVGVFTSEQDVFDTIKDMNLPLGWVCVPVERVIPGWMVPLKPPMAAEALKELADLLPGLYMKYGTVGSRDVDVAEHNAKLDRIAQILKESIHE